MAVTVLNNSSTAMALGELNKNINKVGKTLAKLQTGQRIVNASKDTASFAISERMREQIRSLEQDIQNVQNGSSMLKTAHAGIENIVEELRSLKELAIDAANDSNSDEDRKIIQKEFDQRRDNIDDIASYTHYNTKTLLDGTYKNLSRTFDIDASSNRSKNEYSAGFSVGSPNCSETLATFTGRGIEADKAFQGGYDEEVEEWEDSPFTEGLTWNDGGTDEDGNLTEGTSLDIYNDIAVEMDFSTVDFENSLGGDGFSILCGGCDQFINIKLNAGLDAKNSRRIRPGGDSPSYSYVIGVGDLKDKSQLAKAIYDGVRAIDGSKYRINSNGAEILMLDFRHNVNLMKMNDKY